MREVQARTLFGEDRRGVSSRAGHVQVADLVGAAREVAQGNELDGSGSSHCGVVESGVWLYVGIE